MKYCQHCGRKISKENEFCPYCGAVQTDTTQDGAPYDVRPAAQPSQQGDRQQDMSANNFDFHQTDSTADDRKFWRYHGFFTRFPNADFMHKLLTGVIMGLIGFATSALLPIFIFSRIQTNNNSQLHLPMSSPMVGALYLAIISAIGIALFILPFCNGLMIRLNYRLTMHFYRSMKRHHPERSVDMMDDIINHRIDLTLSILWKVVAGIVLLVIAYYVLAIIVSILALLAVLWLASIFFGPHWHIFPSHWY